MDPKIMVQIPNAQRTFVANAMNLLRQPNQIKQKFFLMF
jgi:hypothetical protein